MEGGGGWRMARSGHKHTGHEHAGHEHGARHAGATRVGHTRTAQDAAASARRLAPPPRPLVVGPRTARRWLLCITAKWGRAATTRAMRAMTITVVVSGLVITVVSCLVALRATPSAAVLEGASVVSPSACVRTRERAQERACAGERE